MKYLLKIEYTGSIEKTAKLTISSKEHGVALSKIPVVLPTLGLDIKSINKMNNLQVVDVVTDKIFEHYDSNGSYKETIDKIKRATGGSYIGTKEQAIIKSSPSKSAIFSQDKTAIVMDEQDFKKVKEILKNNTFDIEMKKVLFQFGNSKVQDQAKPDLNSLLLRLNTITSYLENEQRAVEERMKKRAAEERVKEEPKEKTPLPQKTPAVAPKVASKSKKTSSKNYNSSAYSSNVNRKNDNELDALDIALMYAYPNMAIFMKPTSPIAWFMYFNNQIDQEKIRNEFRNVPGFEQFEDCKVKETNNGYLVTFFDKGEESPGGSLEFNSFDNTYLINSPDGLMTKLTTEDNKFNVQLGHDFDFGSGTTNIDLVQTNDGFVGNWSSDISGINTESGINISNDMEINSTPGQLNYVENSYDFNPSPAPAPAFQPSQDSVEIDSSQDFNNNSDFDYGNNNSYDFKPDEYTPPPPPPPRDEWGSSDPYSNGSSFSGPSF